ncbi:hypothetical protein M3Y96_00169000 [Aphelenchoides besseyi]|nr:hypothetical protein M3Y96_00169000 [Aphelenchoides besseyi]
MVGIHVEKVEVFDGPKHEPPLTNFVILLTTMAVIGGFLFGYDTGIVSAAMLYVVNDKQMGTVNHLWQEWIVAITPAFAAVGSLFAGRLSDRFGRRPLILVSSLIFVVGSLVCGGANGKLMLLLGRVFLGLGIGVASMIVPIYVSETSPMNCRGKMLTSFNIMVCFGQMAANVVAGGFSYVDNYGWRLMFGFAALPALIQLIGFMFLPETPRYLYKFGAEESERILTKIYGGDLAYVKFELDVISAAYERDKVTRRIWKTPHVLRALLIGCSLQLFQQLAGINTLMYYTGALIKSAGIRNNHVVIWLSCITSAVNFGGNFIPFHCLERYGRRKVLLTSVTGVFLMLIALGTSFLIINRDTAVTLAISNDYCSSKSNCDFCVTSDSCGFCESTGTGLGYCLPFTDSQFCSSTNRTLEWQDTTCSTRFTFLPLILMVLYLLCFSGGYASLTWTLNAEFYPRWARGTCVSISTFTNWTANLIVSATFLSLSSAITRFGTFYLYAVLTFIAWVIFYKYVPETNRCNLDEVETLFMSTKRYEQYRSHRRNVNNMEILLGMIEKPLEKPKLCCFIYVLCLMSVLGGFLCGYETGVISSAMLHASNNDFIRPVSHLWVELIVAGMPIAAAIGALFAGKLSDQFGRRIVILGSSLIFGFGSLVCAGAMSKLMLLIGRLLLGLALGLSSCIVPVYLGECSPTHVRGQMLSAFNIFLCFGQMFANVIAGSISYVDPDNFGWRFMFGFAALPSIIQFVGFLFLPESPRWLFVNGEEKTSRHVLHKIYNHSTDWIDYELSEISAVYEKEKQSRKQNGRDDELTIVTIMKTSHVRKSLLIGCSLVVFQQLSGIDTIMYYTAPLLKSAGIQDDHTTIWLSLCTSFVNFFGTLLPFFFIERLGRRKVLLLSTLMTILALLAIASAFLVVNRDTKNAVLIENLTLDDHCSTKSNCDFCTTDDRCGFCAFGEIGVCVPIESNLCAVSSSCETKYTALPLILIVVYLLVFGMGLSTIPWVANAEFYPIWARGTCVSIATCAIWSANAFISLTFLTLASTITRFGTFYFYAAITTVALWVFWKYVPDTAGYSLNEIEFLFMTPTQREKHLKSLHQQMATVKIPDDLSEEIPYKEF